MRVADYIINELGNLGIKEVFEFYGGACADLIDAFTKTNKTRYITVLHEQAGGFAAEAYAKVKGLGAMIATSGPGGHNLVTPIADCYYDSIPCIFITGQVSQEFLRPNDSVRQVGFQESPISEIVRPITKYSKMVTNPNEIRYEFEKAVYLAKNERPGPVLLDIPMNVQSAEIQDNLRCFNPTNHSFDVSKVDEQIERFFNDLSKSKRPCVLVGGGIRIANALDELLEVEEALKIPFFTTWNAIDIVTSDNKYYGGLVGVCGGKGRNFGIQNSDLLLTIGSRLSRRIPGGGAKYFARGAKKYMVEIDKPVLDTQLIDIDERVLCDVKLFLRKLIKRANTEYSYGDFYRDKPLNFTEWNQMVFNWRDRYDSVSKEFYELNSNKGKVHPYSFMRILSEEAGNKDIIIGDTGGNVTAFTQAFETKKGQRAFSSNGNSPMGFSFPAGIGAWFASEKLLGQNVISIIGDGGFNLNIQELQTLRTYKIPLKVFIMNNHCLGFTRQFQKKRFGKTEACGPEGYIPPNFLDIVNAYKIRAVNIEINNTESIRKKIREVLDSKEPTICNVDNGDFDDYKPRIEGKKPLEDMYPYLDRKEFIQNMIEKPLPGWENLYV